MKHGSLFSGIGGFDLASEWMGWDNIFHCEWNEFGKKILNYYWPNAESYHDITKTDFRKYADRIDILTGGFPCQPYSMAGKRKGKEDERHLWPEMLRAIREIRPRWVVGENVFGLINWNGGLVFDEVQTDLEAEGYEVFPYVLPACAVNAPHRRDRVWFVAYRKHNGHIYSVDGGEQREVFKQQGSEGFNGNPFGIESIKSDGIRRVTSDSNNSRQQTFNTQKPFMGEKNRTKTLSGNITESIHRGLWWDGFPTQSPICNGDDGLSHRLDSITFSKWRNESIKAGGNAIVPQVAYEIFKAIEGYELSIL